MPKQMFINLVVKDLRRSIDFFSALGFEFNPQFTNEKSGCLVINDDGFVMLLPEEYFQDFTNRMIANANRSTEVLMGISAASKDAVNETVDKAVSLGAEEVREPQEQGFMFGRSFSDLDGHIWEIFWMDVSAIPAQ